jgi:hypothetical protein
MEAIPGLEVINASVSQKPVLKWIKQSAVRQP